MKRTNLTALLALAAVALIAAIGGLDLITKPFQPAPPPGVAQAPPRFQPPPQHQPRPQPQPFRRGSLPFQNEIPPQSNAGGDWDPLRASVQITPLDFAESQARSIQLSELHYHPPGDFEDSEYLELTNFSDQSISLDGWSFDEGIEYSFPPGSSIPSGASWVLCKDAPSFRARFGDLQSMKGQYDGGLKNAGERLRLKDAEGREIFDFSFDDIAPWPMEADGGGRSLHCLDPGHDPRDAGNWTAKDPTPGRHEQAMQEAAVASLYRIRHQPRAPAPGESVVLKAALANHRPGVEARLHLQAGGRAHELPLALTPSNDGETKTAVGNYNIEVALPAVPEGTLVRYWWTLHAPGVGEKRFPAERSPVPNFAFYAADDPKESRLPVYHLIIEPQLFQRMMMNPRSDEELPAAFVHDGEVYDGARIRCRGAYARSWPKKSYKIFFNDQRLFRGSNRINLNSGWRDPAFCRETLSYRLHREAGSFSLDSRPVRLQVNGEFWGLFIEVEQPEKRYLEDAGLEDAVLYKADSPHRQSDERYFPDKRSYTINYQKETKEEEPYDDLSVFCRDLNQAADLEKFFEERVWLDEYVNYLCALAFTQNWDSFNKNHFVGFDRENGKLFVLPWDLDRTLGDHWNWSFYEHRLPLFLGSADNPGVTGWNRLMDRFFSDPKLRARYLERLKELLETVFTEEKLEPWLAELKRDIGQDGDLDRAKWRGGGGDPDWRRRLDEIGVYFRQRREFLLQQIAAHRG